VLWQLNLNSEGRPASLINLVLCGALFLTAVALIFRNAIMNRYRRQFDRLSPASISLLTVLVGAILGVIVSISSVGAGAVGVTALLLLYPRLPMARIIGFRHRPRGAADAGGRHRALDRGARSIGTSWARSWWARCRES